MVPRPLQNVPLLVAVTFVTAILILAMQLITPSPVMVSLGENSTQTTTVGQYFTYTDIAIAVVSSIACGATGTYLVLHDRAHHFTTQSPSGQHAPHSESDGDVKTHTEEPAKESEAPTSSRERWEQTAARLTNNEETIYSLLIESNGELPQRDLVENTDLSKATVSRTLDKLEHRELVERKRSGMGNTIHLR